MRRREERDWDLVLWEGNALYHLLLLEMLADYRTRRKRRLGNMYTNIWILGDDNEVERLAGFILSDLIVQM